MASANTLCKKLLGVKSAVVTGHDFYQDSDWLNHLRIHARPSKRKHKKTRDDIGIYLVFEKIVTLQGFLDKFI